MAALLQNVYSLDQGYEVVSFDPSDAFRRGAVVPALTVGTLLPRLGAVASFWSALVVQVERCEGELGNVAAVGEALGRQRFARSLKDVMHADFFFACGVFDRVRGIKGGLLHLAHPHLKRTQLLHVTHALDALVRADLTAVVARLTFETTAAEARVRAMMRALYDEILPRAVAALWLWKTTARFQNSANSDREEVRVLWMSILKLRAAALLTEDVGVTLAAVECVVPATKRTVRDPHKPVCQFSLRELWQTLRRLSWDWPLILPGRQARRFVDALWWRCACLASQALPRAVMDHAPLITAAAGTAGLLRVNDSFVNETERILYFVCDSLWTLQWFELRLPTARGGTPEHPATVAPANNAMSLAVLPEWNAFVMRTFAEKLGTFVTLDFKARIWDLNVRRDEIERYNTDTQTTQGTPSKAYIYYHKSDYDFILAVSNSMPINVWGPAVDQVREEIAAAPMRAALDAAVERRRREQQQPLGADAGDAMDIDAPLPLPDARGDSAAEEAARIAQTPVFECRWKPVWELRAEYDTKRRTATQFDSFTVEVGTSGEKHFIDRQSNRRLRGDQAQAAALLFTSHTMCAGKNELDAISEAVLLVCMQSVSGTEKPDLRVYHDSTDSIDTSSLPAHHEILAQVERNCPRILRLANFYVVYNGSETLARVPLLCDALAEWCRYVDSVVEQQLHMIGVTGEDIARNTLQRLGDDPRANMRKVLDYAQKAAKAIPPMLRECFRLQRDPVTLERTDAAGGGAARWYSDELARQFRKHDLWPRAAAAADAGERAAVGLQW